MAAAAAAAAQEQWRLLPFNNAGGWKLRRGSLNPACFAYTALGRAAQWRERITVDMENKEKREDKRKGGRIRREEMSHTVPVPANQCR